ncbi:restriction endonuclease subunit S [Klebsiella aerogenes]
MIGGKLPEGWVGSSLGDVLDVNSGVGFPIKFQGKNSGDYPVYKVSDISVAVTKNNGNLSTAGHYISKEEAVELKGKIFRPGSTAFAKIGEAVKLNRRAIVQSPGLADNNVMVISAVLHEMDKFIFHFMNTIDLSEQARSTTVPSIRKGDIEDIRLALPSISEQKTIAEKLDTLLAQVDSTKARLEQIPQILKRFRQAVLAAATNGKLIEHNKQSLVQWTTNPLKYLFTCIDGDRGPNYPKKNDYLTEGHCLFLSTKNVRDFGFNFDEKVFIDEEKDRLLRKGKLARNDLIITTRGTLGNVASYDETIPYDNVRINSGMLILRKKQEENCNDFLKILIASPIFQKEIQRKKTGSAQPQLPANILKEFLLSIPPVEEQQEIVRRVEQLFAYADTIEKQVNNALTRVNSLTQSILAKAFRGELTAQWRAENPDLISGENSAAALLEKIKAERAASGGKKTSRKKA